MFSDPLGDTVGPGVRIPMIDRIPSGGSIKAGVGNLLYNTLAGGANMVTGALNSTADYISTTYSGGLPGLMNKVDDAYRSVTDFVGGQYNYFANTPNAQIKADTKQFFSNPDNYFQAVEQAAVIGGAWKFSLSFNQTTLATPTASDVSVSTAATSRFDDAFNITTRETSLSTSGLKLSRHLEQLEKYGTAGFKELESGRFRYYGTVTPATKPGEMIGRRVVREWNPASSGTRTWMETLDVNGRVRIVRPETGGRKFHHMFDQIGNYSRKW